MKYPNEIPLISAVLAWLAWAAMVLGAAAKAADMFNASQPKRPREHQEQSEDGDRVAAATDISDANATVGVARRGKFQQRSAEGEVKS